MQIPRTGRKCSAKMPPKSRRVAALWPIVLAGALGGVPGGVPAPLLAAPNPISLENARSGSPQWELTNPALAHEIEGYADRASAAPGETLEIHVSSPSPRDSARSPSLEPKTASSSAAGPSPAACRSGPAG